VPFHVGSEHLTGWVFPSVGMTKAYPFG